LEFDSENIATMLGTVHKRAKVLYTTWNNILNITHWLLVFFIHLFKIKIKINKSKQWITSCIINSELRIHRPHCCERAWNRKLHITVYKVLRIDIFHKKWGTIHCNSTDWNRTMWNITPNVFVWKRNVRHDTPMMPWE